MKTVFLDFGTVNNGDIDPTALADAVSSLTLHEVTSSDQIAERIGDAEIVITNKLRLDRKALESAPGLKLVCLVATGTNNVDMEAARESGVAVCNIVAYCTASVIQHVFAMILSLTHHLGDYHRIMLDGAWRDSPQYCLLDFPIRELSGKTFGIVGFGELGRSAAKLAQALGMKILVANRPGGKEQEVRVSLERLLRESDVVSLHCPLTDATRGLIGAEQISLMTKDALLINAARGALVDSAALADALRSGSIGGAGIDVLPEEPPVHGDPLLDETIPNLIVTPHIAWAALEARQRAIDEVTENIRSFIAGDRRGRVI